ncbi:MAG: 5'/3'-nucleotidase SurE [Methylocystaceae bacterium]
MRILLANDDGISARGLHVLAKTLSTFAEVFIVAPDRERSGTGHSITVFDPIWVDDFVSKDGIKGWVVGGTPADCVKMGISRLVSPPPDLIVSGINKGANLGTDVLYSGTVSAAVEGVIMGIPSIAVSLTTFEHDADYDYAARYTRALIRILTSTGIDKNTLVNVNIPAVAPEEIKGTRITRLGSRRYENLFDKHMDPRGRTYYWMGGDVIEEEQEPDSDVAANQANFISVTPIHFDLTDYRLIEEFKQKFSQYLGE